MASFMLMVALTAFLGGAATAVFLMLFIGIRKADRGGRVSGTVSSRLDSFTRSVTGSGSWPTVPVYFPGREDD